MRNIQDELIVLAQQIEAGERINIEDVDFFESYLLDSNPVISTLSRYCQYRQSARGFRLRGVIEQAQRYEARAEQLYKALPESIRW